MLTYCLDAIQIHSLPDVPYRPGGILPSEMLAFVALCKEQGVTNIVESGRHLGYSTTVLAEAGFELYSVDHEPIHDVDAEFMKYRNVRLFIGEAHRLVPQWIRHRCAVLLDGPKGIPALRLWQSVQNRAVLCGIHDASVNNANGPNPCRQPMTEAGAWFTDDPEYIAATEHLDTEAWQKDYTSRSEMTAQGFTLAMFKGDQWT